MPEIQISINALAIEFTFSQHKNFIMFFYFYFFVVLKKFLVIPVVREKMKVKLARATPTGAVIIPVNEQIDTSPLVALKKIKNLSM